MMLQYFSLMAIRKKATNGYRVNFLVAMQCWPKVKVPAGVILANKNRVYELRTYESAT